jgi:hypothetical protein
MTITAGDNTYGTLAEAETYFSSRFGGSQFAGLATNGEKENALLMAAVLLDSYCIWNGYPTSSEQKLQFPRNGATVIPEQIKKAQFEIAEAIVQQGGGTAEDSLPLKKMEVDVISFEWNASSSSVDVYYNRLVRNYLDPFCGGNGQLSNSVIRV